MSEVLFQKYRPKTMDTYIACDPELKAAVDNYMRPGEMFPNLCLYGGSGTGKSTLAGILINHAIATEQVHPQDVKRVNGSSKNTVDSARYFEELTKDIVMFDYRIILIEEADRLTPDAMKILKAVTEDHMTSTRFIFTTNHISKLDDILLSRFSCFEIKHMSMDDVIPYIAGVLEDEGVACSDMETFMSHIEKHFPNIRSILNSVQDGIRYNDDETKYLVHARDISIVNAAWGEYWSTFTKLTDDDIMNKLLPILVDVTHQNIDEYFDVIVRNLVNFGNHRPNITMILSDYMVKQVGNQRLHLEAFLWHVQLEMTAQEQQQQG